MFKAPFHSEACPTLDDRWNDRPAYTNRASSAQNLNYFSISRRFQNLDYSGSLFCSDAGDLTPVLWLSLDQAISYNTVKCKTLRCAISCVIRAHLRDQHSAKMWNVSLTPESSLCPVLLIGNTFLVD